MQNAQEIVHATLRTMGVDVEKVNPQESVLKVLDKAKPSTSIFKLDFRRGRLLRKIVEAVTAEQVVSGDDREGYEADLLAGGTVDALVGETAKLIRAVEQRSQ